MPVQSVTVSDASGGAKVSAPINLDFNQNPFTVGVACIVTGTVNYTMQYTLDDNSSPTWDPTTATWFDDATIAGKTASQAGSLIIPVTAMRLKLSSGTGSVTMRVLQATNSP